MQLESRETISGEAVKCSFVLSSSEVLCSPGSCYPLLPSAVLLCSAATLCCYPLPSAVLLRTISGKALPCPAPVHCPLLLVLLRCRDLQTMFAFFYIFPTVSFVMCSKLSWKSGWLLVLLKWRPTDICFSILSGSFFLFQRDHNKVGDHLALWANDFFSCLGSQNPKSKNPKSKDPQIGHIFTNLDVSVSGAWWDKWGVKYLVKLCTLNVAPMAHTDKRGCHPERRQKKGE